MMKKNTYCISIHDKHDLHSLWLQTVRIPKISLQILKLKYKLQGKYSEMFLSPKKISSNNKYLASVLQVLSPGE